MLEFLERMKQAVQDNDNEALVDIVQDLVFIGAHDSVQADILMQFAKQ